MPTGHSRLGICQNPGVSDPVPVWLEALEARHLANLRFAEVSRALRALSSTYVERRGRLARGGALQGAGKRAAFALFYGPLHFTLVSAIVRTLGAVDREVRPIVDLGCGTGVAGAAWSLAFARPPRLVGVERHRWAIGEAAWTWRALGLHATTVQNDVTRHRLPGAGAAVVAAYCLNELDRPARDLMRERLIEAAARGARVLVVEPVAGAMVPEWPEWVAAVEAAGGRADQWRLELDLPDLTRRLARAAGLDTRITTAKTLYIPAPNAQRPAPTRPADSSA